MSWCEEWRGVIGVELTQFPFLIAAIGLEEAPSHNYFPTQIQQYTDRRQRLMDALDSVGFPYTVREIGQLGWQVTYSDLLFHRFHTGPTLSWQMLPHYTYLMILRRVLSLNHSTKTSRWLTLSQRPAMSSGESAKGRLGQSSLQILRSLIGPFFPLRH